MSNEILYFAYGSNMATSRMQQRIPDAQVVGVAVLRGWKLVWDKISKDGSGKANLQSASQSETWGVLYRLPETALTHLDRIEGNYQRHTVEVETNDGEKIEAITYISEKRDEALLPFPDYKEFVIKGAQEHGLPDAYIAQINAQPTQPKRDV